MDVRLAPDDEITCSIEEIFDRLARRVIRLNEFCFHRNSAPTSEFIAVCVQSELKMIHSAATVLRVRNQEAASYAILRGLSGVTPETIRHQPQLVALQLHLARERSGKEADDAYDY